jgi:zinc finger RNA-binding protein
VSEAISHTLSAFPRSLTAMTSNYGYGYDQSNYGYQYVMPGNATGAQGTNMYQSNQAVGYGAGTQGSYYYQQQQPSSQAGYNAYSGGATPTNSTYYQQAQTSSSYRTQTQTGYPQTISYPQTGSGSYTASYQYQTPSSGTGTGFSAGYGSTFASMTPQQQQVIQQYASSTAGGAGGNVVSAANKKKPFIRKKPQDQNEYYCETCKVSCGSQLTYKTHLEGKNHKKRLQQLEYQSTQTTAESVKCEICDIVCSNKDSYVAHIKGNKHLRTINLFRRLGKPLPPMTNVHLQEGGVTHVTGPRITFIGGKKLSSTGLMLETGNSQDQPQLYPPGTPADNEVKVAAVSKEGVAGTSDNAAGAGDEPNVEPVGEYLVVSIKNDPRSPLSCFHCQCDVML